jgi:IS30 family transposase
MKAGHDQSQIANLLDRHKSTISRELSRNTGSRGYRPKQACEMSADRAQNSRNAPSVEPSLQGMPILINNFKARPTLPDHLQVGNGAAMKT